MESKTFQGDEVLYKHVQIFNRRLRTQQSSRSRKQANNFKLFNNQSPNARYISPIANQSSTSESSWKYKHAPFIYGQYLKLPVTTIAPFKQDKNSCYSERGLHNSQYSCRKQRFVSWNDQSQKQIITKQPIIQHQRNLSQTNQKMQSFTSQKDQSIISPMKSKQVIKINIKTPTVVAIRKSFMRQRQLPLNKDCLQEQINLQQFSLKCVDKMSKINRQKMRKSAPLKLHNQQRLITLNQCNDNSLKHFELNLDENISPEQNRYTDRRQLIIQANAQERQNQQQTYLYNLAGHKAHPPIKLTNFRSKWSIIINLQESQTPYIPLIEQIPTKQSNDMFLLARAHSLIIQNFSLDVQQAVKFSQSIASEVQFDQARFFTNSLNFLCPQKKILVLDLDETLIHAQDWKVMSDFFIQFRSRNQLTKAGINIRPFISRFLNRMSQLFNLVIFTAGVKEYANKVLQILDPNKKFIKLLLHRDHCFYHRGWYLKDLRSITPDLSRIVIVDNSAYSFALQLNNGIPIIPFYNDQFDTELLKLEKYLLELNQAEDVRQFNSDRLHLHSLLDI